MKHMRPRSPPRSMPTMVLAVIVVIVLAVAAYYYVPHLRVLAEGFTSECSANCLKCSTEPGYLEANAVACDSCAKSCPTQHAVVGAAGPRAEPRESEAGY